ncbi:MAG: HAD family hydrolase [Christensenellaceae bacterium]|nr:HAD family hydrolase [Christensenellaceae bacterium]
MDITTVLFDLDGTLLPMDQDAFTKGYFKLLAAKLAPHGYEPKQLIDAVWAGTAAMVMNDGLHSNETVFWEKFSKIYGERALTDRPLFEHFYAEDFQAARTICGHNPKAAEMVKKLKALGYRVALATNPLFPAIATESRIRWAGLEPRDFELYTTYENTSYCKPNTKYYIDVAKKLNCDPKECLMVGNDVSEDMVAETIGMRVFLLTDCIINKDNRDISSYPNGGFDELLRFVESMGASNFGI